MKGTVEHGRTKVRRSRTNGSVERFNGTIVDMLLRLAMRRIFYDSVKASPTDLDARLVRYSTALPRLGYHHGRRAIDTAILFVRTEVHS